MHHRRQPHDRLRRPRFQASLRRHRLQHHHPAVRHDDRGREPAAIRFFQRCGGVGGGTCAPARGPAGRHRFRSRVLFRFLRQRHHVPGAHTPGAGHHPPTTPQRRALPAGGGDGGQHRECGHHHRQSTEHDDRQFFGNPLPDFRGGTLASRGGGVSVDGDRDCHHLPSGVPAPGEGRAGSTPGAHQPRADVEVADRVGGHDRILLRGLAGSESGAHGRRAAAGYAARETGEDLPRDRLVVAGSLHWTLYRGGGGGEDLPARRPVPRRAAISPGASSGAERLGRPALERRE